MRIPHGALTVLHEPTPGPLTAIAVAVRAGSRFDGAHPGIAHMAEHMLFQGTHRHDQAAINRRAGELGGEHDADTGYEDMTLHFEVFDEDVEEALATPRRAALPLDGAGRPLRQGTPRGDRRDPRPPGGPGQRGARKRLEPLLRRAAGPSDLRHDREPARHDAAGVRRFVARQFVPANMAVCARRRRAAGAHPARPPRARSHPTAPRRRPGPASPRGRAAARCACSRRDLTQTYLVRLVAAPPDPRGVLALSLALEIVGADPDARLFQEVRERLGLGYDVGATVEHGLDWAVAIISASAAREHETRLVDHRRAHLPRRGRGLHRRGAGARPQEAPLPLRPPRRLAARPRAGPRHARRRQPAVAGPRRARPRLPRAAGREPGVARRGRRPDAHRRAGGMRLLGAVLTTCWATALAAADVPLAGIGPCGPIARRHEPIEMSVIRLRRLGGTPIDRIGMVAYRDGKAQPIPFQVDERKPGKGGFAMDGGSEPTTDDRPGVLDPDDLLVFMACDAGERAPSGTPPAAAGREIRLDDPFDGSDGLGLRRRGGSPAAHRPALRRLRSRQRPRDRARLPRRHGARAAGRLLRRVRRPDDAEPARRPPAARRSEAPHRAGGAGRSPSATAAIS